MGPIPSENQVACLINCVHKLVKLFLSDNHKHQIALFSDTTHVLENKNLSAKFHKIDRGCSHFLLVDFLTKTVLNP